jgi:tetratricopeptide (TPR) repeat protein
VLDRFEEDYGKDLVRQIMSYVWASKQGLTEDDFMALTKLQCAEASQLLIALEYHLVQRQGYIRFFHDYLREAVVKKYLSTNEEQLAAHGNLARHYLTEPPSERRAAELPYQFIEGERWEGLHDWLTDIPEFMRYATEGTQWQYIGYWLKLEGNYDRAKSYEDPLAKYATEHNEVEHALAQEQVGRFMIVCGDNATANKLLKTARPIIEDHFGSNDAHTASALSTYGCLLSSMAEYKAAEEPLQRAVSIYESQFGPEDYRVASAIEEVANLFYKEGKYKEAESSSRRALSINERLLGTEHLRTIKTLSTLGVNIYSQGDFASAHDIFKQVLGRLERTVGKFHPEYAAQLTNLAATETSLTNYSIASSLLKEASELNARLLGATHSTTLQIVISMGAVERFAGNFVKADEHYAMVIDSLVHCGRQLDVEMAIALHNRGQLKRLSGDLMSAEAFLAEACSLYSKLLGPTHRDTVGGYIALARLKHHQGKFQEALTLFDQYLPRMTEMRSFSTLTSERSAYVAYIECIEQSNNTDHLRRALESLRQIDEARSKDESVNP